jgi:protein gp37
MGDKTKIEWCDATINPLVGCSYASPACANCYAEKQAARLIKMGLTRYNGTLTEDGRWSGQINSVTTELAKPDRWKRPRKIFVGSMTDLFHENAEPKWVLYILDRCHAAGLINGHTFLFLTKRPENMARLVREWVRNIGEPPKHFWFGATVENTLWAQKRLDHLRDMPAAVRFVSIEPMLGFADLSPWIDSLDWVIVGGESGPDARPMDPKWVRDVAAQCAFADVPFFFKQWGEFRKEWTPDGPVWGRPGKHEAGCDLDGETHKNFPRG